MKLLKCAILLLAFLSLALPRQIVSAHPADMYSQSLTVALDANGIQMDWKILPGPFLADVVWQTADTNQDGAISSDEAAKWVSSFVDGFSVSMDGNNLPPLKVQNIHWPQTVDVLRTGEDSIDVALSLQWPATFAGKHALIFHNSYLEANSLNLFSIQSGQNISFDQPAQNNGQLVLDLYFDSSSHLTSWTSSTPNLPAGLADSVSQLAVNLTNSQPAQPSNHAIAVTNALEGLVKTPQFSPLFLIGAFLLSLVLGSLHALTPGHGKALVAAYLVGSHGRVRDAVFLGSVITVTHTGSVILLGLITLLASHYIVPALITPWLEIISGLLVIGFGLNLLLQRGRELLAWRKKEKAQKLLVAKDGRRFSIAASNNSHASLLNHHHDDKHDRGHSHALPADQITWRALLGLGISGGLVPCPDAIAILLVAVAVNRIPFGMLLIVAFSLGLALVLIGIGIALVQGARLVSRSDVLTRFGMYTPVISALVVSGLGIALTFSAWNSFKFSASFSQPPNVLPVSTPVPQKQSAARLLYVSADAKGRDQLFDISLNGGTPTQYTQDDDGIVGYSVSPDGKTILYSVYKLDGSSTIWSLNADGANKHAVLECPQAECGSPEWYPNGKKIVYERLDVIQNSALPRASLWWLDPLTGQTEAVFQDQAFPSSAPKFSPDGKWLSYISPINNMLMIYNIGAGHDLSIPIGANGTIPQRWSPSSDAILFSQQNNSSDGNAPRHVMKYIIASNQTVALDAAPDEFDYSAAFSPDGQWIAIDRDVFINDAKKRRNQIWLMRPDGSDARAVLSESGVSYSNVKWFPDGNELIFTRYVFPISSNDGGHFDIYMLDIQTGKETLLVQNGDIPTLLP
jgi:ABC-type nickel/cobalt efflux system permease component RcnA/Tol biopolymer transport system component